MVKNKKSFFVGSPYYIWMIIFIVVPMLMVAYYSFTDIDGNFTIENIKNLSEYADTFEL